MANLPEQKGTNFEGEKGTIEQIKQDFLAMMVDVENSLGESKTLLGQLMVALEEMLGVVYQKNQHLKERYKVELGLALTNELSDRELGQLAMTEVDLTLSKLNALNEKQKKLLKNMSTAKMTQLFAGDAKAAKPAQEAKKYFSEIMGVLDKNISANQSMLQQVQQEKERVKLALLHGKKEHVSASDNIAKFVDKLAKILDDKYKMIEMQKKETHDLRQKMERGEPTPEKKPTSTPRYGM
jgi:hypothetical protein